MAGSEESVARHDALYNPDEATWSVLPDGPLPRTYDRFAVADGDRVLLFGSPMVDADQEGQAKVGAAYCAGTRNGDAKNKDKVGVCK